MLEEELEGYQLLTDPCCGQDGFSVSLFNGYHPFFLSSYQARRFRHASLANLIASIRSKVFSFFLIEHETSGHAYVACLLIMF